MSSRTSWPAIARMDGNYACFDPMGDVEPNVVARHRRHPGDAVSRAPGTDDRDLHARSGEDLPHCGRPESGRVGRIRSRIHRTT